MKRIEFIQMMLTEGLTNENVALVEPARYPENRRGMDWIAYNLGLNLDDWKATTNFGTKVERLSDEFVGVVYDNDSDEDIRWAAGYRPDVELRKGRDSICLYCLG